MLLEIKNITKNYNESRGINNINLEFESGHVIGLLGSNGSGKTTLIKLINGLLTPDEGEILVDGKNIGVETKKIISYLPDQTYIENGMTIRARIITREEMKLVVDAPADVNTPAELEEARKYIK